MGAARVVVFLLVALATLQVLQAMGLHKTPFPDWLDEESDTPVNFLLPLSVSWNLTTQWLGALRSSYSNILQYETRETLERMKHFTRNIEDVTTKYKDQIDEILADTDKPTYSSCTENTTFKNVQEVVATEDRRLRGCAATLNSLHDEYKNTLERLTAQVDSRSEEEIYTPCLPTGNTVTLVNRARKCFYANLQVALGGFYYPTGTTVMRAVTTFRTTIASARDEAYACAATSALFPTGDHQSVALGLEETASCLDPARTRVRRGFGKKFKKFLKKAKKGIKKVCSKVPCKVGYSVPFG